MKHVWLLIVGVCTMAVTAQAENVTQVVLDQVVGVSTSKGISPVSKSEIYRSISFKKAGSRDTYGIEFPMSVNNNAILADCINYASANLASSVKRRLIIEYSENARGMTVLESCHVQNVSAL